MTTVFGTSADAPIKVTKIFDFPNYKNLCWAEVGYETNGPQSSKHVMKKYLGKYISHKTAQYTNLHGDEDYPIITFENGKVTPGTDMFAGIFTVECKTSGGRRNKRTLKKRRKTHRHSRRK
jgi:hypothetical protein